MRKSEAGTILLEFLLVSVPLAMVTGCLLLLLHRFFLARELEHEAALAALAGLRSKSSPVLLTCARNSVRPEISAVNSRTHCRTLSRSVRLER